MNETNRILKESERKKKVLCHHLQLKMMRIFITFLSRVHIHAGARTQWIGIGWLSTAIPINAFLLFVTLSTAFFSLFLCLLLHIHRTGSGRSVGPDSGSALTLLKHDKHIYFSSSGWKCVLSIAAAWIWSWLVRDVKSKYIQCIIKQLDMDMCCIYVKCVIPFVLKYKRSLTCSLNERKTASHSNCKTKPITSRMMMISVGCHFRIIE